MEENKNKTVDIHYEKNKMYRSVYSDGAIGGITPLNQINLCFYATRNSIPKTVRFELDEEEKLGKMLAISEDSKSGIIREIEVGVYMNRKTAKELYEFLKNIFDDKKS